MAGDFSEALVEHRRALAVVERVVQKDASRSKRKGAADRLEDPLHLERVALRDLVAELCKQGHPEEAEALFPRLRDGEGGSADSLFWIHYLRGCIQWSRRNYDQASKELQVAMDLSKKHPELLTDLDTVYAWGVVEARLEGDNYKRQGILEMVLKADSDQDWAGVLRWESRMEDVLGGLAETGRARLLRCFALANAKLGHVAKAPPLLARSAHLHGKLERFKDQGADMCQIGQCLTGLKDVDGAAMWFHKVRALGAKHGFFNAECGSTSTPEPSNLNHEPWTLNPEPCVFYRLST
jgi:tetratricopeptide (TPR) repeat protein